MLSKRLILAAGALACAAATAAPAGAAPPSPDCGNASTDPAGDNQNQTTTQQASPNTDMTQFFWRYTTEGGKPRVTANLRVAELDKTVQAPYTAHAYTIEFTVNKEPRLLTAVIDRAGQVGFQYGHPREVTSTDPSPSYEGDTTGQLHEGKDGVIEIDVPMDVFKAAGATFGAATIEARQYAGRTAIGIPVPLIFVAPIADTMTGKGGFVGAPCAAPAVPVQAGPIAGPVTTPLTAAPVALELKVTAPKLVARKVNKAKAFSVKLQSTAPLTAVTGQLKKGARVLGTGRLAKLSGAGTMKLKTRKLKKGTYTLAFAGKGADGRTATAAVSVRVR